MNHNNDNAPATGVAGSLRFLSVCSGIEAASVAWGPLGWRAVAFGEIDKKASELLAYRYPHVPNLGDFTTIDVTTLGRVDILCGGTPCQAFSVAGSRGGLNDARGNLTLAFVELAHALVENNGLRNAVWENVPGVYSDKTNAFGCFLAGLVGADDALVPSAKPADGKSTRWWRWSAKERCHAVRWPSYGMVSGPKGRAAWAIKDAQFYGLAQRRERVLVVADFGSGSDPASVLLIEPGVSWGPPSRGEKGEDVAAFAASSIGGYREAKVSGPVRAAGGDNGGGSENLAIAYAPEIARCDATREGSSQDFESTTMVACVTGDITHTLKAEGADASEDGTGRGTPIVFGWQNSSSQGLSDSQHISPTLDKSKTPAICFTAKDYGADASTELAPTLRAGTHKDSHANGGVGPAITVALRGREGGGTAELGGEVATALRASSGGGDKPHVLTSAVRRLTPRECERLQGFQWQCSPNYPGAWQDEAGRWWSPDYTRIPVRRYPAKRITKNWPEDMWECIPNAEGVGEWWLMTADGPRYKQLGNSWAVPKFRWLGERIQRFMPAVESKDTSLAA